MAHSAQPTTGRKTSATMPPRGKRPGFKIGRNRLPYWIASQLTTGNLGAFPDRCIALPPEADDETLAALCHQHTARLHSWLEEQKNEAAEQGTPVLRTVYDGTVRAACRIYQEHPYSDFHQVSESTRVNAYLPVLRRLERQIGARLIRNLTIADVRHWYSTWRKPAEPGGPERIDRAHDGVAMVRTVIYFCSTLAPRERYRDCQQLAADLEKVKFERGAQREEELTLAQARAFIDKAIEMGEAGVIAVSRARSMAIGVAAQFELTLRQKDIIGGYQRRKADAKVPKGAAVLHTGDRTWMGYFHWDLIPGWRWRMRTSKSKHRQVMDFDLTIYGLLFPLLESVPHAERAGSIIQGDNGLPIVRGTYSRQFRRIARAAGIPDTVWSMDARAGGATEADEAEVPVELIQGSMGHSQAAMTQRYIRGGREKKIRAVGLARQSSRGGDGTA